MDAEDDEDLDPDDLDLLRRAMAAYDAVPVPEEFLDSVCESLPKLWRILEAGVSDRGEPRELDTDRPSTERADPSRAALRAYTCCVSHFAVRTRPPLDLADEWGDYPHVVLPKAEFDALPEPEPWRFSTGGTGGKHKALGRWRQQDGDRWLLAEYATPSSGYTLRRIVLAEVLQGLESLSFFLRAVASEYGWKPK